MEVTSQILAQGITAATQAVGTMEVILAEVTLVEGVTKVRWENG